MDAPIYVFEDAVNFIAERCNTDRETIEKKNNKTLKKMYNLLYAMEMYW
jgi:hypothetical protein